MTLTRLAAVSAVCMLPATAVLAESVSNPYSVDLTEMYAVTQPGSPDPANDEACKEQYAEYMGSTLEGNYTINTETLIMSATAKFLDVDVSLFPLGISGTYAFMSDGVPSALGDRQISRIVVNVSTDFEKVEGDILFVPGGTFNCVLSNLPASNM